MKIKEKIIDLSQILKKAISVFPITIITILIYTVFFAFVLDTNFMNEELFANISFFIIYFGFGSFFTETFLNKDNKNRKYLYLAFIIISFVLVILQNIGLYTEVQTFLYKFIGCYISTLSILSVLYLMKKSNKDFKEFVLKVFINFAKTSIIYLVLSIGIAIISAIFSYLILDGDGYSIIGRLEILLLGFYYAPASLYCLVDLESEVNKFFKGLIKYVLTTLVLIAFVIIYIYIIKILVLRDMPKNQVFRILSALFVIGSPIWTMMQYFKDDSFLYKISLKLPVAFIPFIFLQIYTIGIRILENGITPPRYFCVCLVILEIIYTIIYCLKKEKLQNILLVLNCLIIISVIIPGINMFTLSNISQAKALEIYKTKSELTDKEKEKILGAYNYLEKSVGGTKYIDNLLTKSDIKDIKGFSKYSNSYFYNREYIYFNMENVSVNINGYKKLSFIDSYADRTKAEDQTFKNVKFDYVDNVDEKLNLTVDLTKKFKDYIDVYYRNGNIDFREYVKNNNEIIIENKKIILTYFNVTYNQETKKIEGYTIKGYLLEK